MVAIGIHGNYGYIYKIAFVAFGVQPSYMGYLHSSCVRGMVNYTTIVRGAMYVDVLATDSTTFLEHYDSL